MEISIERQGDRLELVARGAADHDAGAQVFEQLLERLHRASLTRAIIDLRELADPDFATLSIMYALAVERAYGHHLARGRAPLKIAYLLPDPMPAAQDLASNAVSQPAFRSFSKPDAALDWLGA